MFVSPRPRFEGVVIQVGAAGLLVAGSVLLSAVVSATGGGIGEARAMGAAPPLLQGAGRAAPILAVRKKALPAEASVSVHDVGGRYAVLRDKRDTGCMVTLDDQSRVAGGERAQLAPGCRDQGIVIFDPTAWQVVKGELVLTARAGHKTHLQKVGEGSWQKDPKEGGKPLGLKKL